MSNFQKYLLYIFIHIYSSNIIFSQSLEFNGQAIGWVTSKPNETLLSQTGLRYLPEFTFEVQLIEKYQFEFDLTLNGFITESFIKNKESEFDGKVKLYRASFSLKSDVFEARAGLQKINFGSATLFRPLMWFDKIDPRDPLQLTDGVYGLLARYYFLNNANIWLWCLYGNNELKGFEFVLTKKENIEFGGRVQVPIWTGEAGFSFHRREAQINNSTFPENRIGIDGKWDAGIGLWFETTITNLQTQITKIKYNKQWTIGADYTFDIGNGLTILTETYCWENSEKIFGSADGIKYSALSAKYPIGILDNLSTMLYKKWNSNDWFRILTWQRTYDNWIFYVLVFWNPENIQLSSYPSSNLSVSNSFAGAGVQIMLVFNH